MVNGLQDLTYTTDIDYDYLYGLTKDQVIEYAEKRFSVGTMPIPFQSMGKVMLTTAKVLGLELDNEQALFVLSNMRRTLCESCAGSGKTTMSQLCVMKYKLIERIPSSEILCLAYNRNAVADMIDRHKSLANTLNVVLRRQYDKDLQLKRTTKPWSDVMISPTLTASTMHAWAREWNTTYASKLGISHKAQDFALSEEDSIYALEMATRSYTKSLLEKYPDRHLSLSKEVFMSIQQIYSFAMETLTRDNTQAWTEIMSESVGGLRAEDLQEIFDRYDKFKKANRKLDFIDEIHMFYKLLKNPDVMERIRKNYRILLVDEYQDITPAMLRIITIFAEGDAELGIPRYDDLRLICVGDTDQSIYGFRGTDPLNCVRFKADYQRPELSDVCILSMSVNRRCATDILVKARQVIEASPIRIRKPINGLREGGDFRIHEYLSDEDQMKRVLDKILTIPQDEWGDTCICYRNNLSSRYISIKLFEQRIPFKNLKSEMDMFNDPISKLAMNITRLFQFPSSKMHMFDVLFKVLPVGRTLSKKDLKDIIDNVKEETPFWQLPLTDRYKNAPQLEATMQLIHSCYRLYRAGATMHDFMGPLLAKFRTKDHWYFQNATEQEKSFLNYMQDWHSQAISLGALSKIKNETMEAIHEANQRNEGLTLSSFHGLKGLEFQHILMIDMSDNLFPGMEMNRNPNATSDQLEKIRWESERLLYVAITRAKDTCDIFFPKANPSRFKARLVKAEEIQQLDIGADVEFDNDFVTMDQSFVNILGTNASATEITSEFGGMFSGANSNALDMNSSSDEILNQGSISQSMLKDLDSVNIPEGESIFTIPGSAVPTPGSTADVMPLSGDSFSDQINQFVSPGSIQHANPVIGDTVRQIARELAKRSGASFRS